jgi:hypothetical protein
MTWDIEEATQDLRDKKLSIDVNRIDLDVRLMPKYGLTPLPDEREGGYVWSFGVGRFTMPKIFGHGRTVEDAHTNFRTLLAQHGGLEKMAHDYWWR